jgi:hypothetical protein
VRAPQSKTSAVLLATVAALAGATPALAHEGNPSYLSEISRITPATDGVTVDVLNRDDRMLLHNTSGEDVVIEGYSGEPYARVLGDGTVAVNTNSEAFYLNDDRYGDVTVPKGLRGEPKWKKLSGTGRFEWHDHRMHWMSRSKPPQVKDEDAKAHIFDWKVPITVGGAQGRIDGTLDWVPLPGGGLPAGLIWGSAIVLILLCIGVFAIRRRRDPAPGGETAEAW